LERINNMKILSQSKKGTKILLENHEAMLAFTKEGMKISTPAVFSKKDMEGDDAVEKMNDWIEKKNPSLGIFSAIMEFLENMNGGKELEQRRIHKFIPDEDTGKLGGGFSDRKINEN
tara:strand:+ start:2445 stop:2795 length:351 start_codon:yes stop_codon:yes gene_type:complete